MRIGLLLSILLSVQVLWGQGFEMPVSWSFESESLGNSEYNLVFKAKIDEGWAVYSQYIEEGGPIPTSFFIDEADHFEMVGQNEESGNKKEGFDKVFEMKLIKFYKEGIFTQRVKVSDTSQPIAGYLEYMTCNDEECLPPTEVDFSFALSEAAQTATPTNITVAPTGPNPIEGYTFNTSAATTNCDVVAVEESSSSWWKIFLLGFGGGLLALLTPCVFPMIPLTVGFFTKGAEDRATGIKNAVIYGLSIIVIYVALGLFVTGVFGADALNLLSTNAWFNIFFTVLFIVFAISFFGYFEITLPSAWANKSDSMANKGGLIGIFFMAFTLSLVSFSCTGPLIGTLLVETATGGGATIFGRIPVDPLIGMLGFSSALALPFTLFAAFPAWLNSLPKSGGWMSDVKVTLGFVELALALKFLSIADLTEGWKILPYEAFLALWVLCALGLALYFFNKIYFPVNYGKPKQSNGRVVMGVISLALLVYFASGFRYSETSKTFVTPNLLSGLAPPAGHSYIYPNHCPLNLDCFKDFDEGLAHARQVNKPILLDFTGHGCVNCRRMEDNVWNQPGVFELIRDNYVLVSLYVDDRKMLETPYSSPFDQRKRTRVGNKWADFQALYFNRQSQPYYVLVDPNGSNKNVSILNTPVAYTPSVADYQAFLKCGVDRFQEARRTGLK